MDSGWNMGTISFNGINTYIVENCIVPCGLMLLRLLLDIFVEKVAVGLGQIELSGVAYKAHNGQ